MGPHGDPFFPLERAWLFFESLLEKTQTSLHHLHFCVFKKNERWGGGGVAPAHAVLTGLLGSWNERTRATKWD